MISSASYPGVERQSSIDSQGSLQATFAPAFFVAGAVTILMGA